ncbi:hypothetical protein Pma05_24580 [Plantactinospora mayteni]|uniref:FXSXX-COOH protein n=1 Tax=Plantactinospora mayteni TaxID=566021 RepID=A0ABQ4EMK4_9ACTN|nr:hypothetical protein Pma05_24580 [Plantactinospora mayteni]
METRTLSRIIPPERVTRARRTKSAATARSSTSTPIPIQRKTSIDVSDQWLADSVTGLAVSASTVTPELVTERKPPFTS